MAPNDSWLTRTMNAATAGIGNFAGGIVNAVGNGVAGAGRGAGTRYGVLRYLILLVVGLLIRM